MKPTQLIPLPLIVLTAVVGYMMFTGGVSPGAIPAPASPGGRQTQAIAPLLPNAPPYKCASWMDSELCGKLQASCGNGVCDAHERCNTCAFDCGCGGAQVCNPETGACHSPAGVCQAPRGEGVIRPITAVDPASDGKAPIGFVAPNQN